MFCELMHVLFLKHIQNMMNPKIILQGNSKHELARPLTGTLSTLIGGTTPLLCGQLNTVSIRDDPVGCWTVNGALTGDRLWTSTHFSSELPRGISPKSTTASVSLSPRLRLSFPPADTRRWGKRPIPSNVVIFDCCSSLPYLQMALAW